MMSGSKAPTKSVTEKIVYAIRFLKSGSGSSSQAIQKYLESEFGYKNPNAFKKAIKTAVTKGTLVQIKGSFIIAGDILIENTVDKVTIEVLNSSEGDRKVGKGDTITISYKGSVEETGVQFDSGKTFVFIVGAGDVIKGMDQGVLGMCVNERRKLTIPSSLGYGKRGSSPDIPPNSVLCFDIQLKSIDNAHR
jgi:FK506-binding protein 2